MPQMTGNKGEWSEIYVFLRLLELGRLYAADENLEKLFVVDNTGKRNPVFYEILKIMRDEKTAQLEFIYDKVAKTVTVVDTSNGISLNPISIDEFGREADELYETIKAAKSHAFTSVETEKFLDCINVRSIKAKSNDKADIRIVVHDINTGFTREQGFSIKSRLGSPSTLINASKTTNFIYEVKGPMTDAVMDRFNSDEIEPDSENGKSKKRSFVNRFITLSRNGCDIEFRSVENKIFRNNLIMLDGDLPEICGYLLKHYYQFGISNVDEALDVITHDNPVNYDCSAKQPFYRYKFKKLLTECALGMLPGTAWNGVADATGGYIIVREDGEILCYHLFNRNEFENYLVNNTRLDTGSTARNQFGRIEKQNDRYFIKLNLQVRFIK